jgi:SAM-dependent methyltransferase
MDYFELVEISTHHLELNTPAAPEKIWSIGHYLGLDNSQRVIDFGCGYGRVLELWGKDFGVCGVGIDIHAFMCRRAIDRLHRAGLSEKMNVVCTNPIEYDFQENIYDVASCLAATFIWGGFSKALMKMRNAIKPTGKMIVGEPYFTQEKVPQELVKFEGDLHTEFQIIEIAREMGFDVEFVVRASRDDLDRFVSASWFGLLSWLDENQGHPEKDYVRDYLQKNQDMYFRYQRTYEGWAIYILKPNR